MRYTKLVGPLLVIGLLGMNGYPWVAMALFALVLSIVVERES